MKTVLFKPPESLIGIADVLVFKDHGFAADGTPLIPLIDERTGRLIRTGYEMQNATKILLRINGDMRGTRITVRGRDEVCVDQSMTDTLIVETTDGERVFVKIPSDAAIISLLTCNLGLDADPKIITDLLADEPSARKNAILCDPLNTAGKIHLQKIRYDPNTGRWDNGFPDW